MKKTLTSGTGFWRTDRYPIGGDFCRVNPGETLEIELTGKKIDFGQYFGFVEFKAIRAGKNIIGFCRENAK